MATLTVVFSPSLYWVVAMEVARRRELRKAEAAREEAQRLDNATDMALAGQAAQ